MSRSAAVIRSTSAISSAVSSQPTDCAFASTCSGRVAPAMIEATSGFRASQLMASSSSVWPRASAKAASASMVSQCGSRKRRAVLVARAVGQRLALAVLARERAATQRKIRHQPEAQLLHRREQRRFRPPRAVRLYSSCVPTKPGTPVALGGRGGVLQLGGGEIRGGDDADLAGLAISSSSARKVSSIGVEGSGSCMNRRSMRSVFSRCKLASTAAVHVGAAAAMLVGHIRPSACRTWWRAPPRSRRAPSTSPMIVSEPPLLP